MQLASIQDTMRTIKEMDQHFDDSKALSVSLRSIKRPTSRNANRKLLRSSQDEKDQKLESDPKARLSRKGLA